MLVHLKIGINGRLTNKGEQGGRLKHCVANVYTNIKKYVWFTFALAVWPIRKGHRSGIGPPLLLFRHTGWHIMSPDTNAHFKYKCEYKSTKVQGDRWCHVSHFKWKYKDKYTGCPKKNALSEPRPLPVLLSPKLGKQLISWSNDELLP